MQSEGIQQASGAARRYCGVSGQTGGHATSEVLGMEWCPC